MSLTGWLTMIVSIGGVLTAAAWAYYKVLSTPKETEHLGSPLSCPSGDSRSSPAAPKVKLSASGLFILKTSTPLPDVFHFS